jgi:hypothetical protein
VVPLPLHHRNTCALNPDLPGLPRMVDLRVQTS